MKIPNLSDEQYDLLNDELLQEIRKCKEDKNCKNLTCRGFYFEPNKHTIEKWQEECFYKEEGLTKREIKRAIFVCESPGPRGQVETEDIEVKRCWGKEYANPRATWRLERRFPISPIRQNGSKYSYIFKNCYITNIVKCSPHLKDTDHPCDKVIDSCSKWLKKEIEIIQPLVVIAVGGKVKNILQGKYYKELIKKFEDQGKLYTIFHYAHYRSDKELFNKWAEQFQTIINDLKL